MRQSINFIYIPPKIPDPRFSCKQLMLFTIGFACVLFITLIIQGVRLYIASDALATAQAHRSTYQNKITKLAGQLSTIKKNSPVIRLQEQIKDNQAAISYLDKHGDEQQSTVTDLFYSLGEVIVPDVWLTIIEIDDLGNRVYLVGRTNQLAQVYKFVNNLNDHSAFSHLEFELDNIKVPEHGNHKAFSVFSQEQP